MEGRGCFIGENVNLLFYLNISFMANTKSIKGTKTEKNLVAAYMAESAAYSRYTFYGAQAHKESFFPVEKVFTDTAANELRHAKVFFKFLEGGQVEVDMTVDAGVIEATVDNLATAAAEEQREGVDAYIKSAQDADEEGFPEIASHFRAIAEVEARHEKRFRKMIDQINTNTLWKRPEPIEWQCMVCGYTYYGTEPPAVCPACDHPYQHYMPLDLDLD